MNAFSFWWRHAAVSSERRTVSFFWHPHRLLLQLLPPLLQPTPPPPPHLCLPPLTCCSVLQYRRRLSAMWEFLLIVAHSWISVLVRMNPSSLFIHSKHTSGRKQKVSLCAALRIKGSSTPLYLAAELLRPWRTSEKLQLLLLFHQDLGKEKKNVCCLWKKETLRHDFHLIINAEDEEPLPVIRPSVKKVWTAPSRHLSCSVTWTLTVNSCCIYYLVSERSGTTGNL